MNPSATRVLETENTYTEARAELSLMVCDLAPWRVKCSVLRAVSSRSGSGAPRRSVGSELSLRRWFIAPSIPQTYRAEVATPAPGKAPLSMQSSTLSAEHRGTALVPDASSYLSRSSTALDT